MVFGLLGLLLGIFGKLPGTKIRHMPSEMSRGRAGR